MSQSITIQIEAYVPKTIVGKDGSKRLSRKRYRQWVSICRARVLHHDKNVIFVAQLGSYGLYTAEGYPRTVAWKHTRYRLRYRALGWRIHPDSLKRLNERR